MVSEMLILSHFSRVLFNFQSAFFIYLNGCGCSRFQLSIAAEFLDSLPLSGGPYDL